MSSMKWGPLVDEEFRSFTRQESQAAGTEVRSPNRAVTPQLGNRSAGPSMDRPVPSSVREPGCAWRELDNKLGYVHDSCKSGLTSVEVANSRPFASPGTSQVFTFTPVTEAPRGFDYHPPTVGEQQNTQPSREPPDSWQLAGFFTMGSPKADVRRIQGTPTSLTDAEWEYGRSSVYFSSGRVVGWQIHPSAPLKVKMLHPGNFVGSLGFYTVGSTKDDILAVQGTPTHLTDTEWGYGPSSVYFSDGRVAGWRIDSSTPLGVKVLPSGRVDGNRDYFTVGSTKDKVLVVQGTPTSLTDTEWGYGLSSVFFSSGRVVSWRIHPSAPLGLKVPPTGQVDGNRGYFTVGSTKDEVLAVQGTPTILTDPIWGYGRSSVYFRNGRVVSWVDRSDIPLRARMPRPEAHANLGVALAKKGDWDGAIAEYREALRLNPDNDIAHANLGAALGNKGDWDGAIAEYREALRLNPNNDGAHANLGWMLGEKGDLDGAVGEYREALRLNPNNDIAHANLAWVLRDKGDLDGALAEYREKLRLNPNNGNAHYLVGMVLERKGNYEEALGEYRAACELNPQNRVFREGYERLSKRLNH